MNMKTAKTVLLTRPRKQSEAVRPMFESAGFRVLIQPMLEILPAADFSDADRAISRLGDYDRLIFSSANGVHFFFERTKTLGITIPAKKIAAVGPATASALAEYSRPADIVPNDHRAEGLVDALRGEAARGAHFLSVRGDRGRDVLKTEVEALGGSVEEITVYRSVEIKKPDDLIVRQMREGKLNATTVTSSAIAAGLVRLFGENLRQTALVSISPLTSETLRGLGYPPALEAKTASFDGILAAMLTEPDFRSGSD